MVSEGLNDLGTNLNFMVLLPFYLIHCLYLTIVISTFLLYNIFVNLYNQVIISSLNKKFSLILKIFFNLSV